MSVVVADGGDASVSYSRGDAGTSMPPSTEWDGSLPFDLSVRGKRWTAVEYIDEEEATRWNGCSDAERPCSDNLTENSNNSSMTMNRKRASPSNIGVLEAPQPNERCWQSKKRRHIPVSAIEPPSTVENRHFKEETIEKIEDQSNDRLLISDSGQCPHSGPVHLKEATETAEPLAISHIESSPVVVYNAQCKSSQMTLESENDERVERNPSEDSNQPIIEHQRMHRSHEDKSPIDDPIELSRYDVIYLNKFDEQRSERFPRDAHQRKSPTDQPTAYSHAVSGLLTPDNGRPVDLRKKAVEDFIHNASSIVDLSAATSKLCSKDVRSPSPASPCCTSANQVQDPSRTKAEFLSRPNPTFKKPTRRVKSHQVVLKASGNYGYDARRKKKLRGSVDDRWQATAKEDMAENSRRFESSNSLSGPFNGFPRCSSTEIHRYTPSYLATSNHKNPKSEDQAISVKHVSGGSDISLMLHLARKSTDGAAKRVNPSSPMCVEAMIGSCAPKRGYLQGAGEDMNSHRKSRLQYNESISDKFVGLLNHPESSPVSQTTLEPSWKVKQIMANYYAALKRHLFPLGGARFAAPRPVIPFSPPPSMIQRAPVSITVYPYQQHVEASINRSFEHILKHQPHLVSGSQGSPFSPPSNHRWYYESRMKNIQNYGPYYVFSSHARQPFDSQGIYEYPMTETVADNGQYVFPGLMDIGKRLPRSSLSDHVPPPIHGLRGQQLRNDANGYPLLTSATESHPSLCRQYPKGGQRYNAFAEAVNNCVWKPQQAFVHAKLDSNSRQPLPNTGNCAIQESNADPTIQNKASMLRNFRKDTRTLQSVLDGIMKLLVREEGISKEKHADEERITVKEETLTCSSDAARLVLAQVSRSIGVSTTVRGLLDILVEDAVRDFQNDSTVDKVTQEILKADKKKNRRVTPN